MEKGSLSKTAQSREVLLLIVASLMLVFVFVRYIISPLGEKIRGTSEKLVQLKLEEKVLKSQIDLLKKQDTKKRTAAELGENVKLEILKGNREAPVRNVNELIQTIATPSFQHGMTVDALSVKPTESRGGYLATPFELTTHGPFDQTLSFLDKLDRLPALVLVDSVDLAIDAKGKRVIHVALAASFYQMEGLRGAK